MSTPSSAAIAAAAAMQTNVRGRIVANLYKCDCIFDPNPHNMEFTSTQYVNVTCPGGIGTATGMATRTSTVSQGEAELLAIAAAIEEANALLVCTYTSTKSATATCPVGTVGAVQSATATAESTVSQADADALALGQAQVAANALLSCGYNTLISIIGGTNGMVPAVGLTPAKTLTALNLDETEPVTWTGGEATNGNINDINVRTLFGQIELYQGHHVHNIVHVDVNGSYTEFLHGTRDNAGTTSGYIQCASHERSLYQAIGGSFTDWDGYSSAFRDNGIENGAFNIVPVPVDGSFPINVNFIWPNDSAEVLKWIDVTVAPLSADPAGYMGNRYNHVGVLTNPSAVKNPLKLLTANATRSFLAYDTNGALQTINGRGFPGSPQAIIQAGDYGAYPAYLVGGGFSVYGNSSTSTSGQKVYEFDAPDDEVYGSYPVETKHIGSSVLKLNPNGSMEIQFPERWTDYVYVDYQSYSTGTKPADSVETSVIRDDQITETITYVITSSGGGYDNVTKTRTVRNYFPQLTLTTKPLQYFARPYLACINWDGSPNWSLGPLENNRTTFSGTTRYGDTGTATVHSGTFGPNGSVWTLAKAGIGTGTGTLVGGTFTAYDGQPAPGICLIHADGTIDTSFASEVSGNVYCIKTKRTTGVNWQAYVSTDTGLHRLNMDGTKDSSWNVITYTNYATDMSIVPVFRVYTDLTHWIEGEALVVVGKFGTVQNATGYPLSTTGAFICHIGETLDQDGAVVSGIEGKIIAAWKPTFGNTPMATAGISWQTRNEL